MASSKRTLCCSSFKDVTNTTSTDGVNVDNVVGSSTSSTRPPHTDHKERRRQRDREHYAQMSAEKKEELLKKKREARLQKKAIMTVVNAKHQQSPALTQIQCRPNAEMGPDNPRSLRYNAQQMQVMCLPHQEAQERHTSTRHCLLRFKIPIKLADYSMSSFTKQSGTAELLRRASLIIWDQVAMKKHQAVETLDRSLQDIMGCSLPFGGKVMVFGGDFRQVLPLVARSTRAQMTDATLQRSYLWEKITKIRLTRNMRAQSDPWFSEYLLRIGNGIEDTIGDDYVRLPDDIVISYNNTEESMDKLIDHVFPDLHSNAASGAYMSTRGILSTKNDHVDELNARMIDRFPGKEKVYYSFDSVDDDSRNNYPINFLNSITPNGLPPHVLKVTTNCPVILLRNLDPYNSLCNGTRLMVKNFQNNAIDAEIVGGQHTGKRVFIPRIPLSPLEDLSLPFKLKRKQFPTRLSFVMTINKAQGHTIPNVGIYLPEPVFSHGQLYVALSRGVSRQTTRILAKPNKDIDPIRKSTKNIVYRDVLEW